MQPKNDQNTKLLLNHPNENMGNFKVGLEGCSFLHLFLRTFIARSDLPKTVTSHFDNFKAGSNGGWFQEEEMPNKNYRTEV